MNSKHPEKPASLLVTVWVPLPFSRPLDYSFVNGSAGGAIPVRGGRVIVAVNGRSVVGVVASVVPCSDSDSAAAGKSRKLKPVESVVDTTALLSEDTLSLMLWTADYYCGAAGELLSLALPPALRTPGRLAAAQRWLTRDYLRLRSAPDSTVSCGPKQAELLKALTGADDQCLSLDRLKTLGFRKGHADKLVEAGRAERLAINELRLVPEAPTPVTLPAERGHQLITEQTAAVERIAGASGHFRGFLLDGLTGSGKTEVYLAALDRLITDGGQALILLPEISLTPQLTARFEARFPGMVTVYHSGLTDRQRLLTWNDVRLRRRRIVIGTRSAVFLGFASLRLIVVDEEHDSSFKAQDGCRLNARDLAVFRARQHDCPVVLGTATPSLESLRNVLAGRYEQLILRQKSAAFQKPTIEIVNIRSRRLDGGLSEPAMKAISETLDAGRQVLVFLNRRGYAPALYCQGCGWIAGCTRCDSKLTLHRHDRSLRCHHCDLRMSIPRQCPSCSGTSLVPLGSGTEHAEEALQRLAGDYPVIRVDRDTVKTTSALHEKLAAVRSGDPCILLGTQMLAKGHDFHDLTLAVLLDADGAFFSSELRAAEKAMQLLTQVAGRAGRGIHAGRVIVQTRLPSHPLIHQLLEQDYAAFATAELAVREQLLMPPYAAMTVIRADAVSEAALASGLETLKAAIEGDIETSGLTGCVAVHGPFPAVLARRKHRYHGLLWLLAARRGNLRTLMNSLMNGLNAPTGSRPQAGGGKSSALALPGRHGRSQTFSWIIDIDPYDTL